MLWLVIILLIGGLSFVIFHKPHVNAVGTGWVPPEKRVVKPSAAPNQQVTADGSGAVQQPIAPAPQMPDTFDFNELFGGKKQPPRDRSNV